LLLQAAEAAVPAPGRVLLVVVPVVPVVAVQAAYGLLSQRQVAGEA